MTAHQYGISTESKTQILKVGDFLSASNYAADKQLIIPIYQRPYRWQQSHITALLNDLYYQCARLGHRLEKIFNQDDAYRLGTVVLHQEKEADKTQLALVDGQQRTLTLLLITHAAKQSERFKKQLHDFETVTIHLPDCSETQKNLSQNFELIKRHLNSPEFTPEVLNFLLNHCEVVQVTLGDLSEAFQFFDSQNARGLDLRPHDLLKAFHLREFPESENELKQSAVEYWEQQNTGKLKRLFANYLYPIRQWSRGQQATFFSKTEADVFKGVNLNTDNYPFQQSLKTVHITVDGYNEHNHRCLDQHKMQYPFQLTQTLINGRRFFEWVTHYQTLIQPLLNDTEIVGKSWLHTALDAHTKELSQPVAENTGRPTALEIMQLLNTYNRYARGRRGDQYVRRLFNALLLCYYDRFGSHELSRAIEYIFIWAYSLRLKQQSVYLESLEKHIKENNLFIRLQLSLSPVDFLSRPLPQLEVSAASNVEKIEAVFKSLGYYTAELSDKKGQDNGR